MTLATEVTVLVRQIDLDNPAYDGPIIQSSTRCTDEELSRLKFSPLEAVMQMAKACTVQIIEGMKTNLKAQAN